MYIVIYKVYFVTEYFTWAGCQGLDGPATGMGACHPSCKLVSNTIYT